MNLRTATSLLLAFVLPLLAIGCAERQDPTESGIAAHPESWFDPASEDFHGAYIRSVVESAREHGSDLRTGTEGCVSCHGDLGLAEGDQCLTCHALGSSNPTGADPWLIHPAANVWLAPPNDGFHAKVVNELRGSDECSICHGLDYEGGWTGVPCQRCHPYSDLDGNGLWSPHPGADDWFDRDSPDFHGRQVELRGPGDCKACHREGVSDTEAERWASVRPGAICATCHDGGASGHPIASQWIAGRGHADAAQATAEVGANCQRCHGLDLTTGGTAGVSCNQCHTWPFGN